MAKQTQKRAPESKKSYYAVATSDVLDDERLTDKALRLYLHLSRYANQKGYCWAGNATLAEKCHCSARAIRDALKRLEECGYIFRDTDGNGSRRIWVTGAQDSRSEKKAPEEAEENCRGAEEICHRAEENCRGVEENCHRDGGKLPYPQAKICRQNNISLISKKNNPPAVPQGGEPGGKKTIDQEREMWFDWIFSIYPNQNARKPALERWLRLHPSIDFARQVYQTVQAQTAAGKWSPGYWPEFRRWLLDERWNDQLPAPAPKAEAYHSRLIETEDVVYW